MLQLVYISSPSPILVLDDIAEILRVCRRNNGRDGITGMLYADGRRFLQVLEGPREKVEETFARIRQDTRHRAIVVLSQCEIMTREFGNWEMAALQPGVDGEAFVEQVDKLVAKASPNVRATFEGMARVKRAA